MICNHCGKEVESLKSAILELHEQGKSPVEIRNDLHLAGRLKGTKNKMLNTVYTYLRMYQLTPHIK